MIMLIVGGVVAGILGCAAVTAWGIVQVLDIMEALDLRREAKRAELAKAREYLKDPMNYQQYQQDTTTTMGTTHVSSFNVNSWWNDVYGGA